MCLENSRVKKEERREKERTGEGGNKGDMIENKGDMIENKGDMIEIKGQGRYW